MTHELVEHKHSNGRTYRMYARVLRDKLKEDFDLKNVIFKCPHCKKEISRDICKKVSYLTLEQWSGTSYFCPHCDTFARYDNNLKWRDEHAKQKSG